MIFMNAGKEDQKKPEVRHQKESIRLVKNG
jgi:hypothetical protein